MGAGRTGPYTAEHARIVELRPVDHDVRVRAEVFPRRTLEGSRVDSGRECLAVAENTDRDETGQAFGEYAILVAGVAIVCVFAVLFLSGAIQGLFGSSAKPFQPGPLTPPVPKSELVWPTKIEECEDGGWRNYAQFVDEEACTEYVKSLAP